VVAVQDISAINSMSLHAIGDTASLGPWAVTVLEVVAGEEAASLLLQSNNENPLAPDGQVYICVRIGVQNTGNVARSIQMVDFAATGSDGILRRTLAVVVPEPMLQAVVEPGAATEGWIAVTVNDPSAAILWFDTPLLGGLWTDGLLALTADAVLPSFETLEASDTDIGADPGDPAAIGETVTVGGWEVTIDDVIIGGGIFELFDFQTRALGADNSWIENGAGIHATVRNLNPFPAFFSDIAFETADFTGEPWDHTLTLTVAPEIDVSQEYLPGATGEGWATLGGWKYTEYNLIRIVPFKTGGVARYVTIGGGPPSEDQLDEPAAPAEPLDLTAGDLVETTEDLVNLRNQPSTSGDIVAELTLGDQLEITGEPIDADGYTWYPVTVAASSDTGFVVQDFIARLEN